MPCNYLPASPSWYCSRVSDCNDAGIYVFGGKRSLFLFDVSSTPPQNIGHVAAHSDRVVGVSLNKHAGPGLTCSTAGEDKKIKVWDLNQRTLLFEHEEHKHNPTVVHWSECDDNLIASGDERGLVIIWKLSSKSTTSLTPVTSENGHIFCMEWSPHNASHLAIGYKSGMLVVVDVDKDGTILQRLRGHDEEVHSVVWCPVIGEEIEAVADDDGDAESQLNWRRRVEKKTSNYGTGSLLASSSRDRTIRVWSMERGKAAVVLKLPVNTGFRRNRYEDQSKTRVWLTLNWPKNRPRQILSSSHAGEVLLWDLCRPGQKKWDMLSANADIKGHHRIIFNIAVGGPECNTACTIAMDRQVVMWDLNEMSASCSLSSIGGFVYALAASPSNPGHMALGVGDNLLRVWNYANPTNPYECNTFWQGIKSKVTSVCWHPSKEGQLAYGTDDGRVGIYNVLSNKPPQISSTYHRRTVYVVTWGLPRNGRGEANSASYVLYSCGDGVILLHDPQNLDADATNFNDLVEKSAASQKFPIRSEICWKSDYSMFAVGNDDGSVEIFKSSDWKQLCTVRVLQKLVNCVRWHPEHTADVSQASTTQYWIAIGSNDSTIHVVNLHKVLESSQESTESVVINESFRKLEGHTNRITALAWSMHAEGQLVSASFDGTAQVWNVKTGTPLANYRGHSGRLLSVQWSAFDQDVIYTGSEDFTVQAWKISAQENKEPPKEKKKKNRGKKSQAKASSPQPSMTNGNDTAKSNTDSEEVAMLQKMLLEKKQELLASLALEGVDDQGSQPQITSKSENATQRNLSREHGAVDTAVGLDSDAKSSAVTTPTKNDGAKKAPTREQRRRRANRSLLPNLSSFESRGKQSLNADCVDLAMLLNKPDGSGNLSCEPVVPDANRNRDTSRPCQLTSDMWHLGLYTSRRDTYKVIEKERSHHCEHGNDEQHFLLDVWTGDISKTLVEAGEKGRLNDWMMSLAPMASPARWRHLCGLYASQLEKEGSVHKAASYLIAAADITGALALLQRNKLFRDALCLAQLRLSPHDPALTELWLAWADTLIKDGNQEHAAKCFLAIKQPLQAAKTLTKRTDLSALRTAANVTLIAGEKEACKVYGQQYISECLLKNDWLSASQVIQWDFLFKPIGLYVTLHEVFVRELVKLGLYEPDLGDLLQHSVYPESTTDKFPKFLLDESKRGQCVPWKPHLVEEELFIHHIIRLWKVHHDLEFESEQLKLMYTAMHALWETKQQSSEMRQILGELALELTLGLLSLLRGDINMTAYWWAVALATCHTSGHVSIMEGICRLVLPLGPTKLPQLQQEVTAIRLALSSDISGTGPVKSSLPSPHPSSTDLAVKSSVVNDNKYCTSYDCLSAFYYHCVVLHYLSVDMPDVAATSPTTSDSLNMNLSTSKEGEESRNDGLSHENGQGDSKSGGQNEMSCLTDATDAALLQSVDSQQSLASMEGSLDSVQLSSFDVVSPDIDKLPVESPDGGDKNIEISINDAANMCITSCDQSDGDNSAKDNVNDEPLVESIADKIEQPCDDVAHEKDKSGAAASSLNLKLSHAEVTDLAGSLLWTSQARKNQLYAALDAIKHALAALMNKHQQGNITGETSLKTGELLLNPPVMTRTLSGDYLHMKPSMKSPAKKNSLRDNVSPTKIVEDKESEWVEMHDPDMVMNGMHPSPKQEGNIGCDKNGASNNVLPCPSDGTGQDDASSDSGHKMADSVSSMSSSMTQSTVLQTRIYAKARSIFSGMDASMGEEAVALQSSSDKSELDPLDEGLRTNDAPVTRDSPVQIHLNGKDESVPKKEPIDSDKDVLTSNNGYVSKADALLDGGDHASDAQDCPSLPENWDSLPVDVKYSHDSVTLVLLSKEQARVAASLHDVACQMQNCPFPDPLTSAKNLVCLAKLIGMSDEFTSVLADWSLQHAFTREHHEFFKNTLHELTCHAIVPN